MSFLYSIILKLLYPTSVSILLLLAAAALWRIKRERLAKTGFWSALAVLLICGNGWGVEGLTRHLERKYPVLRDDGTTGLQDYGTADCILVLSGGTLPKLPPRPTVEVAEAGDRVLYGAYLYRQGRAPRIICTGNVGTGGIAPRPAADDMAELLVMLGVPKEAIITETKAENTHQHAVNLYPLLRDRGFKRILLVTSALHMPRSMGVFKRSCPGVEFLPAPTDFRVVDLDLPWYREMVNLIPTPSSYFQFPETMHEYLGMAYYRLRGWM
ncbi:MAG: YdcF family protein [Verrucomicrobia bacterium]|nr:YdcF family protein [Verrucomicrobiota bacterium]